MSRDDDQRMKELADRLVAMSPEPPPFPEETTVTQPTKSQPRPILIFVGAAVAVLILAAIPLLLLNNGGGEVPPAATSTTTATTVPVTETTEQPITTTTPSSTTTVGETTTTTATVTGADAVLYLVQSPENSFTGNPALVPFSGVVMPGAEPMHTVIPGLYGLTMPGLTPPPGFSNMVPSEVEILGVSEVVDNTITVDFNDAFLAGSGTGLLGDFTMLNQLIYTATQDGGVESVLFTVDGEPVTQFGTEGLDLTGPQTRESYLDQLNSILVTSLVEGEGDSPLVVSGIANVFEATVSYEIVDADGNVVDEGFTTATCGTGCWGDFSFEVQYQFTGGESVRVLVHSAEDGSPTNVVTVPILWDDPDGWPLVGG